MYNSSYNRLSASQEQAGPIAADPGQEAVEISSVHANFEIAGSFLTPTTDFAIFDPPPTGETTLEAQLRAFTRYVSPPIASPPFGPDAGSQQNNATWNLPADPQRSSSSLVIRSDLSQRRAHRRGDSYDNGGGSRSHRIRQSIPGNNSFSSAESLPLDTFTVSSAGPSDIMLQKEHNAIKEKLQLKAELIIRRMIVATNMFPDADDDEPMLANAAWAEAVHDLKLDSTYGSGADLLDFKPVRDWRTAVVKAAGAVAIDSFCLQQYEDPDMRKKVVLSLAKDGNFVFKNMFFDRMGNSTVLDSGNLARKYPFQNECFILAMKTILFQGFKGRPKVTAHFMHSFIPIPIPTLAFACTAILYALKKEADPKQDRFTVQQYSRDYVHFLVSIIKFNQDFPEKFEESRRMLWDNCRQRVMSAAMALVRPPMQFAENEADLQAMEVLARTSRPAIGAGPSIVE